LIGIDSLLSQWQRTAFQNHGRFDLHPCFWVEKIHMGTKQFGGTFSTANRLPESLEISR
jgi:hypothetical protein